MKLTGTQTGSSCVPSGHGASVPRRPSGGGGAGSGDFGQSDRGEPELARKAAVEFGDCPYRKPTLVGSGKYREVGESTFVKELGKLTP
jgi:hypothetical protein